MFYPCEWVDPFDDTRCDDDATCRISYRGGDNSEIIVPERKMCDKHRRDVERGIERNYRGRRGTLLVDEL